MIFTIIFYLIGLLIFTAAKLLPTFSIYPDSILSGFQYFGSSLMQVNFLFDMYSLCAAIVFIVQFEIAYYTAKIIISIIHTIRGNKTIDI